MRTLATIGEELRLAEQEAERLRRELFEACSANWPVKVGDTVQRTVSRGKVDGGKWVTTELVEQAVVESIRFNDHGLAQEYQVRKLRKDGTPGKDIRTWWWFRNEKAPTKVQ